ncbi:alpha/beta fold hydrolase [Streptomyces sp. NPDC020917]|uniref:alpha/beta fold hydrolase n=1 Tax=Streptomyces sp. NPDC020917 TaxID=3365102 RepID=UPI0037AE0050
MAAQALTSRPSCWRTPRLPVCGRSPALPSCADNPGTPMRAGVRGKKATRRGQMPSKAIFLHGAGKSGARAWPVQALSAPPEWTFLERAEGGDSAQGDAARILELLASNGSSHVVAQSYGGNAAALAAQKRPDLVLSLTLIEPACFDLSRGKPAVENHIAAMDPVFAVSDDPSISARKYSLLFAEGMGTKPPNLPDDVLRSRVARLRAMAPPWGTGLSTDAGLPVRTLVITGGWSPMYDQIAEALVELGADHIVVAGHGHRAQDSAEANGAMLRLWELVS